jgi:hypothetical protein
MRLRTVLCSAVSTVSALVLLGIYNRGSTITGGKVQE